MGIIQGNYDNPYSGGTSLQKHKKIQEIKEKFFEYLESKDTTGEIDADELKDSNASIFLYQSELRNFLQTEGYDKEFTILDIINDVYSEEENTTQDEDIVPESEEDEEDFGAMLAKYADDSEIGGNGITDPQSKHEIFDYAEEFSKYLEEDSEGMELNKNYSYSYEDIFETDYDEEKEELIANENSTKEQKFAIKLINGLLKNDNLRAEFDKDNNGKIDKLEALTYLDYANKFDNDEDNLTLADILNSYLSDFKNKTELNEKDIQTDEKELKEQDELDQLDEEDEKVKKEAEKTENTNSADKTTSKPSSGGGGGGSRGGGYNASGAQTITSKGATEGSEDIAKQIQQKEQEIQNDESLILEQNKLKAKAYEDDEIYTGLVDELNRTKEEITTADSNITTMGIELHSTEVSINTKEAELANLFDPVIFTEYQDEINQKRAALNSELTALKAKKTELETKIQTEEDNKEKLTEKEDTTQKEVEKYEQENPKDEIQQANSEIERLEGEITTLNGDIVKLQADLEKQRKQEKEDAEVYGKLKAEREGGNEMVKWMMDNATSDSTINKYNNTDWGGAWCAIYTSEMTEALYAEVGRRLGVNLKNSQALGGSQVAMNSSAYGRKYAGDYKAAGMNAEAVVDVTNWSEEDRKNAVRNGHIRPGMTFQYCVHGNYHTGFIERINEDLTWVTSEGNSTGGKWGAHVRDASYYKFEDATDTTLSMYWLAIQCGKITAEEVNKRTGTNFA